MICYHNVDLTEVELNEDRYIKRLLEIMKTMCATSETPKVIAHFIVGTKMRATDVEDLFCPCNLHETGRQYSDIRDYLLEANIEQCENCDTWTPSGDCAPADGDEELTGVCSKCRKELK